MSEIANVIELVEERFNEIAPYGLTYASEKGFAIQALKSNDYLRKVAQDQPQSLQQAITNIAAIGLSLSPAEKLAYLIPRAGKICLDVSYMGFCRLATNSGAIEWIQAELVGKDDEKFTNKGMGERPDHDYDGFATLEERGGFRGVYCTAKTTKGDYLTTLMSAADVYGIRDRSEAYKKNQSGPWATDFGEMAKKSVVRRAYKMWPQSDERANERMTLAVHLSNENEGFKPITTSPEIRDFTLDQKGYLDQLIESSNATGMAAFRTSLEEGVWTSLYHSFPHGEKGKYQKIIESMAAKGLDALKGYAEKIEIAVQANDDLAVNEIIGELAEDEVSFVANLLSEEAVGFMREVTT